MRAILEQHKEFDIFVPTDIIKNDTFKAILLSQDVKFIVFSSDQILDAAGYYHEVEKSLKKIKPDVYSYKTLFSSPDVQQDAFCWELFVSHKVEEPKAELYITHNIPLAACFCGRGSMTCRCRAMALHPH